MTKQRTLNKLPAGASEWFFSTIQAVSLVSGDLILSSSAAQAG
jgi:hypothetical protein